MRSKINTRLHLALLMFPFLTKVIFILTVQKTATGELCSDSLSGCTCYPRGKPLIEGNADGLPALPVTAVGRLCFPWLELCVSVRYFSPRASPSPLGAFSCSTVKSNKQEECTRVGTDHLGLAVEGGRSTYASSSDKIHSARHRQLSVTAYVEGQVCRNTYL